MIMLLRSLRTNWPLLYRKCTVLRLIASIVFVALLYNEYLSYIFKSLQWSALQIKSSHTAQQLRVLFVADPQLIGLQDELQIVGPFSRWDSDRFIRRTFRQAYWHVQPDVVVFLGDLLDEGSHASEEDYQSYMKRFDDIFYTPPNVKHVYISGDNDVGGEGIDLKLQHKVDRFIKYFLKVKSDQAELVTTVKFLDFVNLRFDEDETIEMLEEQLMEMSKKYSGKYRVWCNHMGILSRNTLQLVLPALDCDYGTTWDGQTRRRMEGVVRRYAGTFPVLLNHMNLLSRDATFYQPILKETKASIIFTAHTHLGKLYTCLDCREDNPSLAGRRFAWKGNTHVLADYSVHTFNLRDKLTIHEVVVPTCSYRMGVPVMGYGAAIFDENGAVAFTILWTPSRYFQLFSHIVALSLIAILLLFSCLRTVFYPTFASIFHRRNKSYKHLPLAYVPPTGI